MNQITLGLDPLHKKTRKEVFLEEMNKVVPWQALVARSSSHKPVEHTKRSVGARRLQWRPCCASTACSSGGT